VKKLLNEYESFINQRRFCNNSFTNEAYSSPMIVQHQNSECLQCGEYKCTQCGMHLNPDLCMDAHLINCHPISDQQNTLKKYDFSHWAED